MTVRPLESTKRKFIDTLRDMGASDEMLAIAEKVQSRPDPEPPCDAYRGLAALVHGGGMIDIPICRYCGWLRVQHASEAPHE